MQDLIEQERFEIEVLDRLNSGRFLRIFIFCGGTMLRLCHGLDRFSLDLDFWRVDQSPRAKNFQGSYRLSFKILFRQRCPRKNTTPM